MHIHPSSMNLNPTLTSAAGAEKAAEAQRAADVRKRLLKSAQSIPEGSSPEETLLISSWLDGRHSQSGSPQQNFANISGKDPEFG